MEHEKPRLMALVFGLRLTVVSLLMLTFSSALFAWPVSQSRDGETLFVLFSIFSLSVSGVLIFIRFSSHLHRLLLLTPLVALAPVGARATLGLLLFSVLMFLEAFRRESGGKPWFLGAQSVLLLGGLGLAFLNKGWLWISSFWLLSLGVPALFASGCWAWQQSIKVELTSLDRDDDQATSRVVPCGELGQSGSITEE